MLHEVVIMTMPITRGESEPHTGSGLELDDDAALGCAATFERRRTQLVRFYAQYDTTKTDERNGHPRQKSTRRALEHQARMFQ